MQRMDLERPQHVWLSPPCGPFSPLQRTNQRTPEQVQELKTKRQRAIRIYVGTTCVMHYAIQRGIHVTLELAERSDAWRLPVLNQLQKKYMLHQAVTKGCAVGLRNPKDGRLMQKGWRILTTHRRLAEALELPCRCQKGSSHGKCEGISATESARYTPDYVRRAARVICQELNHQDTIRECTGSSFLVQGFGEGEFCTCGEVCLPGVPRTCPHCMMGKEVFRKEQDVTSCSGCSELDVRSTLLAQPGCTGQAVKDSGELGDQGSGLVSTLELDVITEASEEPRHEPPEEYFSQSSVEGVEQQAREFRQQEKFQHHECEQVLQHLQFPSRSQSRDKVEGPQPRYLTLGAYAHGNQYGLTKWTYKFPELSRYVLQYLKHWSPEDVNCSSLVINDDSSIGMHRDVHNAPGTKNYLIGVTRYQHGGLWLEGPSSQPKQTQVAKVLPSGKHVLGHVVPTCQQVVVFDARGWHEVQKWQGRREVITAFTSRGARFLSAQEKQFLEQLGMSWQESKESMHGEICVASAPNPTSSRSQTQIEEEIKKKLYLLHAATGHGSTRHMVDALKRRNADPLVLKLAQEFTCSVCQERNRVSSRQVATLEALPPKFHTIAADIGHWNHVRTGEQQNFMVIMDEGSRYRVAKILSKGSKKTPNAATCINYFSEGWIQMFGKPKALRLDPAGGFRSNALESFCDRHDIFLDLVPGEAHWQIGIAEQAIQGLKALMTKMCEQDPDLGPEEALSEEGRREIVRGFSPVQHVLGQAPDEAGRLLPGISTIVEEPVLNQPLQEFQREAERRAVAEQALSDWQAKERVRRAMNSRTRPTCSYMPGDLVYFWRTQEAGKSNKHPGTSHGRFLGPARILAMETRHGPGQESRPGNAIWLVRGRRLLKCSREQLRPASPREEAIESLTPSSLDLQSCGK